MYKACKLYDFKNLDEHKDFYQCNTTCEVIARQVWLVIARQLLANKSRGGSVAWYGVEGMRIVVYESDEAFVEYEQSLFALYDEMNAQQAALTAETLTGAANATASASAAAAACVAEKHTLLKQQTAAAKNNSPSNSAQISGEDDDVTNARNDAIDLARRAQNASNEALIAAKRAKLALRKAECSKRGAYFRVAVRGRAMVARSLLEAQPEDQANPRRGPLHGNTIVVDAIFTGRELQEEAGYMVK
jgi:hypothetical protein